MKGWCGLSICQGKPKKFSVSCTQRQKQRLTQCFLLGKPKLFILNRFSAAQLAAGGWSRWNCFGLRVHFPLAHVLRPGLKLCSVLFVWHHRLWWEILLPEVKNGITNLKWNGLEHMDFMMVHSNAISNFMFPVCAGKYRNYDSFRAPTEDLCMHKNMNIQHLTLWRSPCLLVFLDWAQNQF